MGKGEVLTLLFEMYYRMNLAFLEENNKCKITNENIINGVFQNILQLFYILNKNRIIQKLLHILYSKETKFIYNLFITIYICSICNFIKNKTFFLLIKLTWTEYIHL